MRLSRLVMLCIGVAAFTACSSDEVTDSVFPPLAGVRFINALSDTGAVDIRFIDQIEFSAVANALAFRAGTEHQPTEAKARRLRVFPTSTNPAITSAFMVDTTLTFTENSRVTLLLTGSARSKTVRFVVLTDDVPSLSAGQIAVRVVNTATGAVDGYVVTAATDPIPGAPAAANVLPLTTSSYLTRATGAVAVRVTDRGSVTVNASAAGPVSPPAIVGANPGAGVNTSGSALSAFYFPRCVVGIASTVCTPTTPGIVWFVDRVPTA